MRLVLAVLSSILAVKRVGGQSVGAGSGGEAVAGGTPASSGPPSSNGHAAIDSSSSDLAGGVLIDKASSLVARFTPPKDLLESLVRLGCLYVHVDSDTRIMVRRCSTQRTPRVAMQH